MTVVTRKVSRPTNYGAASVLVKPLEGHLRSLPIQMVTFEKRTPKVEVSTCGNAQAATVSVKAGSWINTSTANREPVRRR